jgi:hypothetical protein
MRLGFRTLLLVWGLSISMSFAGSIPRGFESYLSRPDALTIKPKAHPELDQNSWRGLKRSHFEAIAQMIELYPEHEIYFLARDSELLYDLAKVKLKDDAQASKRIHLLNISRSNMSAKNVKNYLAQEGISEAVLASGKKILLVDTGFSGTISGVLKTYFPEELRKNMQTHLMSSSNPAHPSSRVFLSGLDPNAPKRVPSSMHSSILSYEYMPRYTDRSDRFVEVDGKWHPLSSKYTASDGHVSKTGAKAHLEDILFEAETPAMKILFDERRRQWRELTNLKTKSETKKYLSELLKSHPNDPFIESMVRDYLETVSLHFPQNLSNSPKLKDLGLEWLGDVIEGELGNDAESIAIRERVREVRSRMGSNKREFSKGNRFWMKVLNDPDREIRKLVVAKNFSALTQIIDGVRDEEIQQIIYRELGHGFNAKSKKFIQSLIARGDPEILNRLAKETFANQRYSPKMNSVIEELIDRGDQKAIETLAYEFSYNANTKEKGNLFKKMVEKAVDPETKEALLSAANDRNWMLGDGEVFKKALKKADLSERKAYLDKMLPHLNGGVPRPDPLAGDLFKTSLADQAIEPGQTLKLNSKEFTVIQMVDKRNEQMIYQIKDSKGEFFVLNVAKDRKAKSIDALEDSYEKNKYFHKRKVAHGKLLYKGNDYFIREQVEGIRGDQWIQNWVKEGSPDSKEFKALTDFIKRGKKFELYMTHDELIPRELVLTKKGWGFGENGFVKEKAFPKINIEPYQDRFPPRFFGICQKRTRDFLIDLFMNGK